MNTAVLLVPLILLTAAVTFPSASPQLLASWNPRVSCAPTLTTIRAITNGMTGNASLASSPFRPGMNSTVYGSDGAKRWLTYSPYIPFNWTSPGPDCAFFVEIDNVARGSTAYQDFSIFYQYINGHTIHPVGPCGRSSSCGDFTFNMCDMNVTGGKCDSGECKLANDTSCTGKLHTEIDHDWLAAGYCGVLTVCSNQTIVNSVRAQTTFDIQGFVFWDPGHVTAQWHSFSGWEIHPLTGIRLHVCACTAPSGGGGRRMLPT